ncbi:MAG: flagellar hook-basal body complex protein [Planctomycetota bacterium]
MVSTSLFTGLSGLRTHQQYIDVIGNNLANVSTPGFWSSRATFGDILSFTMRSGSGPSGNFGGQNPMQVGLGTQIASIDMNTGQGTFQDTGRQLDVAIQGKGFFTVTDGLRTFYTRVGTFGIDADRTLVDLRSGLRVVNAAGSNIEIPLTATLAPQASTEITFEGNLPAVVTGPLEEIVESSSPFLAGTAATASAAPTGATTYDISAFPNGKLLLSVNSGAQQTIDFSSTHFADPAAATATEIAARFDQVAGLTTTADPTSGGVAFATVILGDNAGLKFDDASSSVGLLQALGLPSARQNGTESAADGDTDLASLTTRTAAYEAGDQITVGGTDPDGEQVSDTFIYGTDGTTIDSLLTFIETTFGTAQVNASIDTSGVLRLEAADKGPANLSLSIGDTSSKNNYPTFTIVQNGTGPDTAVTPMDVIDSLGRTHPVNMTFTRSESDPAVWDMQASMDASEGEIIADTISTIRFNQDGSFNVIGGGSSTLSFLFAGITAPQNITVNLGTSGQFDGIAMVGSSTSVTATGQDGYATGELLNIAFEEAGRLQGFYSNGQTRTLDTLRITLFPNEGGLLRVGDTLFVESPNSENPIATSAGNAGAGVIRPGSLENSNVDIAEEFVKLITAQRGFQANSRVISTADEILAELVNIVR